MKVQAQLVSKKKDNVTWCRPSDGYMNDTGNETIDLKEYEEIDRVEGDLDDSDMLWPRGAPFAGHIKVGETVFKKKLL